MPDWNWTLIFLVLAIAFGALGFGAVVPAMAAFAKVLAIILAMLVILSLFAERGRLR